MAGAFPSRKRLPKDYFTSGFVTRADSIRELAAKAGIDADGLEQTIGR